MTEVLDFKDEEEPLDMILETDETCDDCEKFGKDRLLVEERIMLPLLLLKILTDKYTILLLVLYYK